MPRSMQRLMKLLRRTTALDNDEFDEMSSAKYDDGGNFLCKENDSPKKRAFFHFFRSPKSFVTKNGNVYATQLEENELVSDGHQMISRGIIPIQNQT